MTQAILETIATPSMDQKTYSVNVKGLMKHIVDVLFGASNKPSTAAYDTSLLSSHLQKDLGLY
ncbi:hypothetical protein ACGRL8_16645 [Vibrio rumoiensis]|uniref:Uncharacterized protein n=1 Tax=Vibrio rumoiensis TaxID=76258 RepID=A0ABW7IZT3_9VIBR|nr:hypothetical protein [Vibrio rumoiensis]